MRTVPVAALEVARILLGTNRSRVIGVVASASAGPDLQMQKEASAVARRLWLVLVGSERIRSKWRIRDGSGA